MDGTEIIANVTKIFLGIHDAVRAGRQVKAQTVDLENLKNDLIRVSTSGAPGASGGVGVLTEAEYRPTSADHEEIIGPSSIATRSGLASPARSLTVKGGLKWLSFLEVFCYSV